MSSQEMAAEKSDFWPRLEAMVPLMMPGTSLLLLASISLSVGSSGCLPSRICSLFSLLLLFFRRTLLTMTLTDLTLSANFDD
jgi:hypothetical protein